MLLLFERFRMNLKEYIAAHRLRVEEVAKLCGVKPQAVYNWFYDSRKVPDGHAKLIQFYANASEQTRNLYSVNVFKVVAEKVEESKVEWPAGIDTPQRQRDYACAVWMLWRETGENSEEKPADHIRELYKEVWEATPNPYKKERGALQLSKLLSPEGLLQYAPLVAKLEPQQPRTMRIEENEIRTLPTKTRMAELEAKLGNNEPLTESEVDEAESLNLI